MTVRNTLENIRIVLIHTSHPGNIGSAARAMKTMGLNTLFLVKPKKFPDEQAIAMSSNAKDILDRAIVVDSIEEAVADCHFVVGASARSERSLEWDVTDSRTCGELLVQEAKMAKVAIVLGRESSGLTNEELAICHQLVHIPTNPDYRSLNLASAVQILAYECRVALLEKKNIASGDSNNNSNESKNSDINATVKEVEGYYQHLEQLMIESNFLDPENPRHLMKRLRRLYGRVRLSRSELNILRGMLSALQKKNKS